MAPVSSCNCLSKTDGSKVVIASSAQENVNAGLTTKGEKN